MLSHARLAVWGDPIEHSLSPRLHAAAYRALGLDWDYGRQRVDVPGFDAALAALDSSWRGLSLTMPLKGVAHAAARARDRAAELTGAVNTLLLTADGPRGFNTDVGGIAADLQALGLAGLDRARIVGAGATATSALVGLASLGVRRVEVTARRREAIAALEGLGERLGVKVVPLSFGAPSDEVPLTFATLPGGARLAEPDAEALAAGGGVLYDVVYGHWPTVLASAWQRRGERAIPGIGMLVRQALLQVRVFVREDVEAPLDREDAVLAAMQAAVTGD